MIYHAETLRATGPVFGGRVNYNREIILSERSRLSDDVLSTSDIPHPSPGNEYATTIYCAKDPICGRASASSL